MIGLPDCSTIAALRRQLLQLIDPAVKPIDGIGERVRTVSGRAEGNIYLFTHLCVPPIKDILRLLFIGIVTTINAVNGFCGVTFDNGDVVSLEPE